jgi:hypothetical protein
LLGESSSVGAVTLEEETLMAAASEKSNNHTDKKPYMPHNITPVCASGKAYFF